MATEPTTWECECGKVHQFGVWVAAHWNEKLEHTCDECQRKHTVLRGRVTLSPEKKKKK